jgi:alanine racemase
VIAELTIDCAALRRNVSRLRALAAPARYAAVIKGNAYGHGLIATARALEPVIDAFCVYRADEAFALRAAGIAAPLLVLGPVEPHELEALAATGAALTLWSEGAFRRDLARVAERRGAPYPVHAKIDTGVTRLGLDVARAPLALAAYLAAPDLALHGVYTHLAAAEELESDYTLGQLARFEAALRPVTQELAARGVIRHAAASRHALSEVTARYDPRRYRDLRHMALTRDARGGRAAGSARARPRLDDEARRRARRPDRTSRRLRLHVRYRTALAYRRAADRLRRRRAARRFQ